MAGEFDLHQLLAGPIIAMNDAQANAAASFYELFEQFAFETPGDSDDVVSSAARRLKMISFIAERAVEGRLERRQISIPLIQMIPMGGIGIDSAKIEFSLAVNAEPSSAARTTLSAAAAPAAAERAVTLKGRIAPAAASDAATAGNLRVEIMLKQVDLPAGYIDMIAETQGGMSRIVQETAVIVEADNVKLFTVALLDPTVPAVMPGGEYAIPIEIVPDSSLIGQRGLEIALKSEPERALQIAAPESPIEMGGDPQRERLYVWADQEIAKYGSSTKVAVRLTGTSIGPDGVKREHSVRIILPRKGGLA